jgi:hypothetical protein
MLQKNNPTNTISNQLKYFRRCYIKMNELIALANYQFIENNIKIQPKTNCSSIYDIQILDEDVSNTCAVLLKLRPFILQNEDYYLTKIIKKCKQICQSDQVMLTTINEISDHLNSPHYFMQQRNSNIFWSFINGEYYHTDEAEMLKLEEIYHNGVGEVCKYFFLRYVKDYVITVNKIKIKIIEPLILTLDNNSHLDTINL